MRRSVPFFEQFHGPSSLRGKYNRDSVMRKEPALQACSVTPCEPPLRFLHRRGRLAALLCGLAIAGCAPDYEAYSDGLPERPAVRSKRQAAVNPAVKPVAPKPVPVPARALLAPPAKPDCEADTADEQRVASLAPPAPDTNADLALRIKLEYERECYRQAEARMRERLQQLQASTGETIKAVQEMERSVAR